MKVQRSDIDRIKRRWSVEKKISGKDVAYLLEAADTAITLQSANELRQQANRGQGMSGALRDILGGL